MDTVSVKEAQERLDDLITHATKNRRHYKITSDEGNVIVLPEDTYDNILITLELLSTPGLFDKVNCKTSHKV